MTSKKIDRVVIGNIILRLVKGDITEMEVDAIVNAANDRLILGHGVAGAIKAKGGPSIQAECDKIGAIHVGEAVITTGGNLKAQFVIHAVGPRMGEGNEAEKLENATMNSLLLAGNKRLRSIAFPAISAGAFGYPIKDSADVMLRTVVKYMRNPPKDSVAEIWFCLFDDAALDVFHSKLSEILHGSSGLPKGKEDCPVSKPVFVKTKKTTYCRKAAKRKA